MEKAFPRHAAWIGGKLIQLMHTKMVQEQVNTMKIQAEIQVLRRGELRDNFSCGSALEDYITLLFVLVRNISCRVSLASKAWDYKYPLHTSMEG
ncbi:hypothetical protein Tco_0722673 [Tanacetum coccineum]